MRIRTTWGSASQNKPSPSNDQSESSLVSPLSHTQGHERRNLLMYRLLGARGEKENERLEEREEEEEEDECVVTMRLP